MARAFYLFLVFALACQCVPVLANTVESDPERQIVVTVSNPSRPGLAGASSTWTGWSWTGGYRVSTMAIATARSIAEDYDLVEVDAWPISVLGVYCVVYRVKADTNRATVISAMNADDRVQLAQPLNLFATSAAEDGGDEPYRGLQQGLVDVAIGDLHSVATGRGVRVAVIDTGAQLEHPDIRRNVGRHADFVRRNGDQFTDDVHGTAIAGVIAAAAGNREGIVGVAPEARLILLKACWPVLEGSASARCNSFTLARAIVAAREMKASIVNLSLAGPDDPLLEQLIQVLINDGIAVVGAEPEDLSLQPFPSSVNGVIAVRGAHRELRPARFSVPAPGTDIITTVPTADYQYLSGNSLAVAHVSGIMALLRQLDGRLTPSDLAQLLFDSTTDRDIAGKSVNACDVLSRVQERIYCQDI